MSSSRRGSLLERGIVFVLGLAAWGLVAVAIALDPAPEGLGTHTQLGMAPCTFFQMTGQPCPGCGMTTAFANMAHGRVWAALIAQPFGAVLFVIVLTLAVVLTMSALAGRSLKPVFYSQRVPTVLYGLILLWLAGWGFKMLYGQLTGGYAP